MSLARGPVEGVEASPPSPAPGADGPLRVAYLRLADPVGTPGRLAYLVLALACVTGFGILLKGNRGSWIIPSSVGAGIVYLVVRSWRARSIASKSTPVEIRERFRRDAAGALDRAASLPIRAVVWLALACGAGVAAWKWGLLVSILMFPVGAFAGAMGFLLGLRCLFEWWIEVPALRRELAVLGIAPVA